MCVSGCARCVGLTLVPLSLICMLANILLLLPALDGHFLLEGHVTREATWSTGIWASGLLVLVGSRAFVSSSKTRGCCAFRTEMLCVVCYSCVCVAAAGLCCVVSGTGLARGPLCLYNSSSTHTLTWGTPLKPTPDGNPGYLYNRTLWSSVCVEPGAVVEWNVLLFGVMMLCSGLQTALCAVSLLNSLLGALLGPCCCNNKVSPA